MTLGRIRTWRPTPGWIAFVAVWVVWVGLAMGQLNDLLGAMHVSGSPSFTASDVNRFFHRGPDQGQSVNVLQVWKAHAVESVAAAGESSPPADAREIVSLFAVLDSLLFVPLYALALALFFRRAELGPAQHLHAVARRGRRLIVVAAAFDLIENLGLYKLVNRGWDVSLEHDASTLDGWLRVLWIGALGKWLLAGLAVLSALLVAWVLFAEWLGAHRQSGRGAGTARRAHLVGFQVAVVVSAVVVLNQQGQLADLYRRWQAPQLLLSLLAMTFAGFAVWVVTRRLIVRGTWSPVRTPERERSLKRLLFGLVVALAAAQFLAHLVWDDASFDPGWGLVVPALLLFIVAILGRRLGHEDDETDDPEPADPVAASGVASAEPSEPVLPRLLTAVLVIGFAFALLRASFGYAVYTNQWQWRQLALLAGGALAGALLTPVLGRLPVPAGLPGRVVAEPVTAAALGTLVVLGASAPWHEGDVQPTVLVALSALLVVGALRWYVALGRVLRPSSDLNRATIVIVALLLLAVPAVLVALPVEAGQALSAPGVIAAFLAALFVVSGISGWVATGIPQPRAFSAIRLPHFPVTTVIVVWFLVASFADRTGAYHDARIRDGDAPARGLTVQDALGCWLGRHGLDPAAAAVPGCGASAGTASAGIIPFVLVASTGGGIRSAYWTALTLDCAFEVDLDAVPAGDPCPPKPRRPDFAFSDALFATSGISGGSLGQAEYAAYLVGKETGHASANWVEKRLEVDGLSPSGARWLFVEIPRVFLQFDGPDDRAAILEQAWERRWPDHELETGLLELTRERLHVPFLMLNSTSVGDGCRFNVSALDAGIALADGGAQFTCRSNAPFDEAPGTVPRSPAPDGRVSPSSTLAATRDLTDLLCGQPLDLSLSTAALLSARFPFVNPSGRVASRCASDPRRSVVHAVDGGYLDTSGASPVIELMAVLGPELEAWNAEPSHAGTCVVPFLIQIDNGFEDTAPPRAGRRPPELAVPLRTVFDTRIGRAAESRTEAALLFTQPFPGAAVGDEPVGDRYAHFVNQAHPGPAAPFGWAQSRFSQKELQGQLSQMKNRQALAEIRSWRRHIADGSLRCTT